MKTDRLYVTLPFIFLGVLSSAHGVPQEPLPSESPVCATPDMTADAVVDACDLLQCVREWKANAPSTTPDFSCDERLNGLDLFVFQNHWHELTSPRVCPGDATIRNQEDVDRVAGCEIIAGDLSIRSSAVDLDLSTLRSLVRVAGDLRITNNSQLTSLEGLHNLTALEGGLWIGCYGLHCTGNPALVSLEGLRGLTRVGGWLTVQDNRLLDSLEGLESLESVGGYLTIKGNPSLASLDGLRSLETLRGSLYVHDNPRLGSFAGIENLSSIEGNFSVHDNDVLTCLDGLNHLVRVGGWLRIEDNPLLFDLSALGNLTDLAGPSTIRTNLSLDCAAQDLPFFPVGESSGNLSQCPSSCPGSFALTTQDEVDALAGCALIEGNLTIGPCRTRLDLTPLSLLRRIRGDFTILRSDALTDLRNLSKLARVDGTLTIEDNLLLASLEGLQGLLEVGGDLALHDNTFLSDISSLEGLNHLGGVSQIRDNPSLDCAAYALPFFPATETEGNLVDCNEQAKGFCAGPFTLASQPDVDALAGCTAIDGSLTIGPASGELDLRPLASLVHIRGDLRITDTAGLTTLDGLQALKTVEGDLSINRNDSLVNVNALNGLTSVRGTASVYDNPILDCSYCDLPLVTPVQSGNNLVDYPITYAGTFVLKTQADVDALTGCAGILGSLQVGPSNVDLDLTPLASLTWVSGSLSVSRNLALTGLDGLQSLDRIGQDLIIHDNPHLYSLAPLVGITCVDDLEISENPVLTSLEGLRRLNQVRGSLAIASNDSLSSLNGLLQLTRVGSLEVFENSSLTSLSGLDRVAAVKGPLTILSNENLVSLHGLHRIIGVRGDLLIGDNPVLRDVSALESMASIGKGTSIFDNPSLDCAAFALPFFPMDDSSGNLVDCDGSPSGHCSGIPLIQEQSQVDAIAHCTVIDGNLTVGPTESALDLTPLNSLVHVTRDVFIRGNSGMTTLGGLSNLTSVGESLRIGYCDNDGKCAGNPSLRSLAGLNGLFSVGDDLTVRDNETLTDLSALGNLVRVAELIISGNSGLESLTG